MGSENQIWKNLKKYFDYEDVFYQRIEDTLQKGIPDVFVSINGHCAWYEIKQLDVFPSRASTPVRLNYRKEQYAWMKNYMEKGGYGGLITQVGLDYFFHDNIGDLHAISNGLYVTNTFKINATLRLRPAATFAVSLIDLLYERG